VSDDYPNVEKEALKKLLHFPSTYVNPDSHTLLHVKTKIETNSSLLQKTILDVFFPRRNQEFSIWSKTAHKCKNHTEV